MTSAIAGGRGGASSSRAVYSLNGETLTLEMSGSLPDGSLGQVRTATVREVHAGADAGAAEPDGRAWLHEPVQRQGPDRLEGERESRIVQSRERRHRRQRDRAGLAPVLRRRRSATTRFAISICGSTCSRATARTAASTS